MATYPITEEDSLDHENDNNNINILVQKEPEVVAVSPIIEEEP